MLFTLTALILNPGVLETGSTWEDVRLLAGVSLKWKGRKTMPAGTLSVTLTAPATEPLREDT